jgi:hypothetical protein
MGARAAETAGQLLEPGRRLPAARFPPAGSASDAPGLYAWFVDVEGASQLSAGLGAPVRPGLVYAGQAGAGASSATLRSRIRANHLGGSITGSTFRMTLASVLARDLVLVDEGGRRLSGEGESRLTAWMLEHLSVAVAAAPDRAALSALEDEVLALLDPPLNLQGMAPTGARELLRRRRRRPLGRGGSAP